MVEVCTAQGPLQSAVITGGLPIKDGFLDLPDKPGFGVEIPDDLEARFPFVEGHYAIEINRSTHMKAGE